MIIIGLKKCQNNSCSRHNTAYELLNTLAKHYLEISDFSAKMKKDANGKPYLADCAFSISHSECAVAVALCVKGASVPSIDIEDIIEIKIEDDCTVMGVDIECMSGKDNIKLRKIAHSRFFDSENQLLDSYTGYDYTKQFCHIWTQKEAYGKYTSFGMRDSLSYDTVKGIAGVILYTDDITIGEREYSLSLCYNSNSEK